MRELTDSASAPGPDGRGWVEVRAACTDPAVRGRGLPPG